MRLPTRRGDILTCEPFIPRRSSPGVSLEEPGLEDEGVCPGLWWSTMSSSVVLLTLRGPDIPISRYQPQINYGETLLRQQTDKQTTQFPDPPKYQPGNDIHTSRYLIIGEEIKLFVGGPFSCRCVFQLRTAGDLLC